MEKFNADKLMDARVELSEAIDKIVTIRELLHKGYRTFEVTNRPMVALNVSESAKMLLDELSGEIKAISFDIDSFRDQAFKEIEKELE